MAVERLLNSNTDTMYSKNRYISAQHNAKLHADLLAVLDVHFGCLFNFFPGNAH
jgi:hypothetical protein